MVFVFQMHLKVLNGSARSGSVKLSGAVMASNPREILIFDVGW
jgi:hypothetical protein